MVHGRTHKFTVGSFICIAISDGTHTYAPPTFPVPGLFLFANAPRELLGQTLAKHSLQLEQWQEWVSPYICLVVDTGEHLVLVDTGANGLSQNTGKLVRNLKEEGIEPEDIDSIILTHGHPDHIGGNTDNEGSLTFPSASYFMWKGEWDFWNSEEAVLRLDEHTREILVAYARKNLPPIQDRIRLVDREAEILPGIRAISAPGHTPGHMALAISSKREQLLCISDAVLHPIHLERPEWCAVVDLDPGQVEATRHKILARPATEKALVLAFHFPFPGLGHIVPSGKRWHWQPMEI